MSLFDAAERLAALDRSGVVLDAARCLHSQDKYATCALCFELCPVGAIQVGRPPVLDAAACKSCMACLPACPVGAYQADDSVAHLMNCIPHLEGKPIDIICSLHPAPNTGVKPELTGLRVQGCLAVLGTGAYLALVALGLEQIILRCDACGACEWGCLRQRISDQVERANALLVAWNHPAEIACVERVGKPAERPLWEAKNPPLSRRDLFRMLGRQGQVALARAMEQHERQTGQFLGRDRLRLLSAVEHLPPAACADSLELSGFDFATLVISEACTACGVCARACPTGALCLEKNAEESEYRLIIDYRKCIGCELCMHVCAPAAISINHAPTFAEVFGKGAVILQEGELVKCDRCGTPIAKRAGVKLCPVCEYRRKNPFGSVLPPGLGQSRDVEHSSGKKNKKNTGKE